MTASRIASVIVTYHPDLEKLAALLAAIASEVQTTYVIDNSGPDQTLPPESPNVQITRMGGNRGIAAALNKGIHLAINQGFERVLMLDQDSMPTPGMVNLLRDVMDDTTAAAGPMYFDQLNDHHSTFMKFEAGKLRMIQYDPDHPDQVVDTDFLISSGCLISTTAFKIIGPLDEALFIDHVDTEWCFRAVQAGYKLKGITGSHMQHRLGESSKRVWIGRWRRASVHKPFRYYYIFRNSVVMIKVTWRVRHWRSLHIKRLVLLVAFISLSSSAIKNLRFAGLGIYHGLINRLGPLPDHQS